MVFFEFLYENISAYMIIAFMLGLGFGFFAGVVAYFFHSKEQLKYLDTIRRDNKRLYKKCKKLQKELESTKIALHNVYSRR